MDSDDERDAVIAELRFKQRLTERAIAEKVGMSPAGVHQACVRLSGKPRDQARYRTCDRCKQDTKLSELNSAGVCVDCDGVPRSDVHGVHWHKPTRKWRARIKHNGQEIHLGLFDTVAEAETAVADARRHLKETA